MTVVRVKTTNGWEDLSVATPSLVPIEPWHVVGAAGEPAFRTGWVNYPDSPPTYYYEDLAFRKTPNGEIQLKGLVDAVAGAADGSVFTLPPGYRPAQFIQIPTTFYDGNFKACVINIAPDGSVSLGGVPAPPSSIGWVTFDNLQFWSEQTTFPAAGTNVLAIEPWQQATMNSPWAQYAPNPMVFRKTPDGQVQIRGYATNTGGGFTFGTATARLFTLPVGYRPPVDQILQAVVNDVADAKYSSAMLTIGANGDVVISTIEGATISGATSSYVYISGVAFPTDQGTIPAAPAMGGLAEGAGRVIGSEAVASGNFTTGIMPFFGDAAASQPMQLVLRPSINCWWPVSGEALLKVLDAVWYRANVGLQLSPADVDGVTLMTDGAMHHSGATDWSHGSPSALWKLAAGTTYTCQMGVAGTSGGTWQHYRGGGGSQGHMYIFSPGIVPR